MVLGAFGVFNTFRHNPVVEIWRSGNGDECAEEKNLSTDNEPLADTNRCPRNRHRGRNNETRRRAVVDRIYPFRNTCIRLRTIRFRGRRFSNRRTGLWPVLGNRALASSRHARVKSAFTREYGILCTEQRETHDVHELPVRFRDERTVNVFRAPRKFRTAGNSIGKPLSPVTVNGLPDVHEEDRSRFPAIVLRRFSRLYLTCYLLVTMHARSCAYVISLPHRPRFRMESDRPRSYTLRFYRIDVVRALTFEQCRTH